MLILNWRWVPFHYSWGPFTRKKRSLFLTKWHCLTTVIFWNIALPLANGAYLARSPFFNSGSPTFSSMPQLLPHQCPNFVFFNALKFYIYPPTAQIYASHLIHKLCSSFIRTNPPTSTLFFLYLDKPLSVIFLAVRENQPQSWCCHCEGEMPMLVLCELYLNFLYSDVLVCFSFLLGVVEFCMNKISMELCGFVCGFCIFVWLICGFLSISFNYVGLSFYICLYLDCVGFIWIFLCGHVSTGKLCIAMLLWVSIFWVICEVWGTKLI